MWEISLYLDYIFLRNCLQDSIKSAKTFDDDVDNTSDHLPIQLKLSYTVSDSVSTCDESSKDSRSKLKIHWSIFLSEIINRLYKSPLVSDLERISISSFTDSAAAIDKITELLTGHSHPLADTRLKPCKKKNKCGFYVKLPADIKRARSECKAAFDSWKDNEYPSDNEIHNVYHSKRKYYHSHLHCFNQVETYRIKKLCNAVSTDEKLFWKLLKGQCSSSQMSSFLVDGKLVTDKKQIREMWADHFKELGTPSENTQFDSDFLTCMTTNVQEVSYFLH